MSRISSRLTVSPGAAGVQRVTGAVRQEMAYYRPRLHAALLFSALLPDLVGNRLRTAALRFAGVEIGPQTVFGGAIGLSGPGRPERRLRVGARTWINAGCYFDASDEIEIGSNVAIAQQVTILTQTHDVGGPERRAGELRTAPVRIGDGCWIGARAVILPGVTVGEGALVAAGSVVCDNVPAHTLVGGIPARRIRSLEAPGREG